MTLHLFLKSCWHRMVADGTKKEEYREIKPYWTKRLFARPYNVVAFHNAYTAEAICFALDGIVQGEGRVRWGAKKHTKYYIIKIGRRL